MTAPLVAALVLLAGSGFVDAWIGLALAGAAAAAGLFAAGRAGGRAAIAQPVVAALLPGIGVAILAPTHPRLALFPLAAAALEAAALVRTIADRRPLIEAWLCLGARPLELLPRVRSRLRPAILAGLALLVPAMAKPDPRTAASCVAALAGIAIAAFAASVLVALRAFVDFRLVDRAPAEADAPFRLKPYEAPSVPHVYESRPGRERPQGP